MSSLQSYVRQMRWQRHIPGAQLWNRLVCRREHPNLGVDAFGLHFAHPVGLAPVWDHQEDLLDEFDDLGFSFTGIVPGETPVQSIVQRLSDRTSPILTAIELRAEGTSESQAKDTLIRTYALLYDFADLFVVDVNRQTGQTSLDDFSDWTDILDELLDLRLCYDRYTPILLRIPPGHPDEEIEELLDFCLLSGIDGVIAPGVEMVRLVVSHTKGRLPVAGSGAITSPDEALSLLEAGACLVEVAQGLPGWGCTTAKKLLQAIDKPDKDA